MLQALWQKGPNKMLDWNGRPVEAARSRGGVCVLADPLDNLLHDDRSPWPSPEVLQKLTISSHGSAFADDQRAICEAGLSYYCDLQSLHSEDALTWSVFGTLLHASQTALESWLSDLFNLVDLADATPEQGQVFLWRRLPHPDGFGRNGPEIDFGILTANAVILGEAKWLSKVAEKQGREQNEDQIQLRGRLLSVQARRLYPHAEALAVVGVGLTADGFARDVPAGIDFRATTWADVCGLPSHPLAEELQRYYAWKREHTLGLRV